MAKISDVLAARMAPATPPLDYYANAMAATPCATINLPDLIDGIRSNEFAGQVATIRKLIASGNQERADELKRKLPAVSLSGSVSGRRKNAAEEGRMQHSGLLQIDLDGKDNIGWSIGEIREVLEADPRIVATFISASGAGVKAVARIPANPSTHKASFLAAEAHFRSLNLRIDPACKDPVRLCFVSHDPEARILTHGTAADMFAPVLEVLSGPLPADSLVLRDSFGDGRVEINAEAVREMLSHIPPRPDYSEWLRIASAVWDAVGEAEGTALLHAWSPEERPGEYSDKFGKKLNDVRVGTLIMLARSHGWLPHEPVSSVASSSAEASDAAAASLIPSHIFPVPSGEIGHDLAARHIFSIIGPTNRLFMRGTTVHEIAAENTGESSLAPVDSDRFCSQVETFGKRIARREQDKEGIVRWRSATFPQGAAKIALASDGAREYLPHIRQLVAAPVIVPDGNGGALVLGKGYHTHAGGTYVTAGGIPPIVPLDVALADIMLLLADFDFPSEGDASRAVASIISPALKFGGWLEDDFPLDIAEADKSQSGKTYRQKLVCSLYGEAPSAITQPAGGVGSLDERVSTALITGRPFISFDNFRGRLDSQILETAIRGLGKVSARALRVAIDVDSTPFLWQLSTNGAELTRDLANRSIVTRIRKRADDYPFQTFPEGPTHLHLAANQPRYLGAVFAIVREWARHGCPRTNENRHDFRAWCQCLDWIVQNIFGLAPLLDGHREEQLRTANPRLQWLRDVVHAALHDGYQPMQTLRAADLAAIAEDHDIQLPGQRSLEEMAARVGKLMGRLYRDVGSDSITVDGHRVTRVVDEEYDAANRKIRETRSYVIE